MKILILKIIILVELLLFLGLFVFYPQYDCDNCTFKIEGKSVSTEKFIDLYFDECVNQEDVYTINMARYHNNSGFTSIYVNSSNPSERYDDKIAYAKYLQSLEWFNR